MQASHSPGFFFHKERSEISEWLAGDSVHRIIAERQGGKDEQQLCLSFIDSAQ